MQLLFAALQCSSQFFPKPLLHLLLGMRSICYIEQDDTKSSNNFNYNRSEVIVIFFYKIWKQFSYWILERKVIGFPKNISGLSKIQKDIMICGKSTSVHVGYMIAEFLASLPSIILILNTGILLWKAKSRFRWLIKKQVNLFHNYYTDQSSLPKIRRTYSSSITTLLQGPRCPWLGWWILPSWVKFEKECTIGWSRKDYNGWVYHRLSKFTINNVV